MKKIVVAAEDDRDLAGALGAHFGRCPFYVLAHVTNAGDVHETEIHENPHARRHEAGQVPLFIRSLGADVVIAAGMGQKAIGWFERLGIEVATGSRDSVGAALQAYLHGEIRGAFGCAGHEGGSQD
jgi:predicted Fe-Mo cluster-binding NifX family protein